LSHIVSFLCFVANSSPLFTMLEGPAEQAFTQPTSTAQYPTYVVPDPRDHGACARFRMRRKASRIPSSRRSSSANSAILQLQQTTLQLHQQMNYLHELMLQQARVFEDHISSCRDMTRDMTSLLAAAPMANTFRQSLNTNDLASSIPTFPSSLSSNYGPSPLHSNSSFEKITDNAMGAVAVAHPP